MARSHLSAKCRSRSCHAPKKSRSSRAHCATKGYCLACRHKEYISDGHVRSFYNKRSHRHVKMCCGICEKCGTKMCSIVKSA